MVEDEMIDLAILEPVFHEEGIVVPHLKVLVDIGTFVRLVALPGRPPLGRLLKWRIDAAPGRNGAGKLVLVNFYNRETGGKLSHLSTVSKYMSVVVQSGASSWVDVGDLEDICFVFSRSKVDDMTYVAQGRSDCFLTEGPLVLFFPCQSSVFRMEQSLMGTIWHDMSLIRRVLLKLLCSTRQDQGEAATARDIVTISPQGWGYIKRRAHTFSGGVTQMVSLAKTRVEYEVMTGGASVSKRRMYETDSLSFSGHDGVRAIAGLFGECSILGIRQRRPKLSHGVRQTVTNETFNCLEELKFHYFNRSVSVAVRYTAYHFNTSRDGEPMKCPNIMVRAVLMRQPASMELLDDEQAEQTPNESDDALVVGEKFNMNGSIYQIIALNETTCDVSNGNVTIVLGKHEVSGLVDAYYN